jgi:hypothetical protein
MGGVKQLAKEMIEKSATHGVSAQVKMKTSIKVSPGPSKTKKKAGDGIRTWKKPSGSM